MHGVLIEMQTGKAWFAWLQGHGVEMPSAAKLFWLIVHGLSGNVTP